MEPRTLFGKLVAYALLLIGSFLFLFPFVWLVSTSLKPMEQTSTMPPQWVPRDYRGPIGGVAQQVVLGAELLSAEYVIRIEEGPFAGEKRRVAPEEYHDGTVRIMMGGGEVRRVKAKLLYLAEPGWYFVEQRREKQEIDELSDWEIVPAEAVSSRARLFWENYPNAIERMGARTVWLPLKGEFEISLGWLFLRNTLIVCILGVIGTVASSAVVGYSLARIPWRGRGSLFAVTLATMMIPFPVLMVPMYTLFKMFGWIGTLLPLWVPAFFGSGFNIFLLRQFFLTIPRDLSEAARIDGCSEFGIFWRIILPLSKPALAVVALFHFLFAWNDFMGPLLYLTKEHTYTLSLGLQAFRSAQGGTDWPSLMAASTLICLPIIVLFFFTQKTFIKGIATTGMKG